MSVLCVLYSTKKKTSTIKKKGARKENKQQKDQKETNEKNTVEGSNVRLLCTG
jgi:hypothetical protein